MAPLPGVCCEPPTLPNLGQALCLTPETGVTRTLRDGAKVLNHKEFCV
jgi:hypothetical protein